MSAAQFRPGCLFGRDAGLRRVACVEARNDRRTLVDLEREVRRSATAEVSPLLNLKADQFLDHADERVERDDVFVHTSILLSARPLCRTHAVADPPARQSASQGRAG
jgi:hypothetical protein